MKAGSLRRALAKIRIHDAREMTFAIYCTPSEFQALGVKPTLPYEDGWNRHDVQVGRSNQGWHYFRLPKKRGQTAEQVLADFKHGKGTKENAD